MTSAQARRAIHGGNNTYRTIAQISETPSDLSTRRLTRQRTNAPTLHSVKTGKVRRGDILAFIRQHTGERGMPPTIREIGAAVGLTSSSSVKAHLDRLVRDGKVLHEPQKPRSYRAVEGPAMPPWATTLSKSLADIHHLLDGVTANTVSNRTLTCVRALAAEGGAVLQAQLAKETTP